MSKLVMQPSFRAVGQTHAEWSTFEKPENKRRMYGSLASVAPSLWGESEGATLITAA